MALKLWSLDWLLSASPGHWLETQILRPHSRLAESDPWSEPGSPHLASLLGGVDTAWEPRVKDISEYWHKSSNQKAANEQNLSFGKEDSGRGQDRIWTRRSLDQIQGHLDTAGSQEMTPASFGMSFTRPLRSQVKRKLSTKTCLFTHVTEISWPWLSCTCSWF